MSEYGLGRVVSLMSVAYVFFLDTACLIGDRCMKVSGR